MTRPAANRSANVQQAPLSAVEAPPASDAPQPAGMSWGWRIGPVSVVNGFRLSAGL